MKENKSPWRMQRAKSQKVNKSKEIYDGGGLMDSRWRSRRTTIDNCCPNSVGVSGAVALRS